MDNNWLHKGMEQDAQRIEVRMPKVDNNQEIREFASKVLSFIDKNTVTQTELARRVGISSAQLNQFLRGKYKGDLGGLCSKLTNYINTFERRRRRTKGAEFIETSVAKAIMSVIRSAEAFSLPQEGRIALIIGDAGHGKSVCLQQYAKTNPNSIYVKLNDTISAKAMFAMIAAAMGLDYSDSIKSITERISNHLSKRELTVLIDEASALGVSKLNQLRQIITERGCTLILAGNSYLLKTINQDVAKKGCESLDQFRSRLMAVFNLDEFVAFGGKKGGVLYSADIRLLYEYGGIRLDSNAVTTLKKIISTPLSGRFRTCSIIIDAIHNSAEAKAGEIIIITAELVMAVIKQLGLPVMDRLPVTIAEIRHDDTVIAEKATA